MLTVHFNGEIVRHADHKASRARLEQRRETDKICSFGVPESLCKTFAQWQKEQPIQAGKNLLNHRLNCRRCPLADLHTSEIIDGIEWKNYTCPRAQKRYVNAIKPKKYCIDWKVFRKLASAAHYIIKESEHKTLFLTLTFPKFKQNEISEKDANKCLSKFLENLKTTYSCEHYLCVRERGEDNNRLHYHLVCAIPFVSFGKLNSSWCHAIQDFCHFSKNSVQSDGSNRVIKNPARAVKYVCKYISKNINNESDSRVYFISNNTLSSLVVDTVTGEITRKSNIKRTIENRNISITDFLQNCKGIFIQQYDFVTVYKVTGNENYCKLCKDCLYPLFNCSNCPINMTVNPDKLS